MGLTTSLYTSLSGMDANSQMLSVAGNNIANVNTTAFKKSRVTFETQLSRNLAPGSAPSADLGGTNPSQVGLGVRVASINRDFTGGALQISGVNTDVAIEGGGFFTLNVDGTQRYSRAGNFTLDGNFNLVGQNTGGLVQGYGVDDDFNIVDGVLTDMQIPLGVQTIAEATETVKFAGNLNAGGDVATVGSTITSSALYTDAAGTTPATAGDALTSLFDADGNAAFATGDVITVSGVTRGGATIADRTFEVGATNTTDSTDNGTTLQDVVDFMEDILGINTGQANGLSVTAGGEILIEGNVGTSNDLSLAAANFVVNRTTSPSTPLTFSKSVQADGESVRTTFIGYDSLGDAVNLDLTFVLEDRDNAGTEWRFFVNSDDNADADDLSSAVHTGTATFDNDGKLVTINDSTITLDREGTGAVTPQEIELKFQDPFGAVSALVDTTSEISAFNQDGSPIGTLEDFAIGEDGVITGVFSNSLLRPLGQLALSNFANPAGLEEVSANLFRPTTNSGTATLVTPGNGGSGRTVGGALELSNVDIAEEFISLINASTGFSASSRVLTTSDELIQELLSVVR